VARRLGYRKILLDTLPAMRIAVKLYRELGFDEAPAYYQTPVEGTQFLALDLENWSEDALNNRTLHHLFDFNRAWSKKMREVDPGYFEKLSHLQTPELLWIGCSDSRVPANEIVGLLPGEVFVHRNVANVVVHTDLNCLSVIQFAVDVLKVKHVMVVGHYGCGGVKAALDGDRVGLVDIWLRHVRDVRAKHLQKIDTLPPEARHDRLCELNVLEQVANVCQTYVVQDAWARGQPLTVHGWIYGLKDGLMRDLDITVGRLRLADLRPARQRRDQGRRRARRPQAGAGRRGHHGLRAARRPGPGAGAPGIARRRSATGGRLHHGEQDVRLRHACGDVRA
jgi:carbonic anhydrase